VKKAVSLVLVLLTALLLPPLVFSEDYKGWVVGITDGDTLTLLVDGKRQVKVRLAEIDTPESKQPYGKRAKQELSALAFNKIARVQVQDIDRYGRKVGRIFVDGVDVNAEMVRRGAAWVYRKYARDAQLFNLEDEAIQNKRGLWKLPESERVPPWEWRLNRRSQKTTKHPLIKQAQPLGALASPLGFSAGNLPQASILDERHAFA
jgi:micrococcal nuclease